MAPVPVKREYMAEFIQGMGSNFYLIWAASPMAIRERYPLFEVYEIGGSSHTPEQLEILRMYPGEGRPFDYAVQDRSAEERNQFVVAAVAQRERARARMVAANFPIPAKEPQYWVDLDDDAEFRIQMHEIWKDDPRYLELSPRQRLF